MEGIEAQNFPGKPAIYLTEPLDLTVDGSTATLEYEPLGIYIPTDCFTIEQINGILASSIRSLYMFLEENKESDLHAISLAKKKHLYSLIDRVEY